jgi:hypothetical protein
VALGGLVNVILGEADLDIQRALSALASDSSSSDESVVRDLESQGVSHARAEKLVALVPLAFGRVLLGHLGQRDDSDVFCLPNGRGDYVERSLRKEPIFLRALELAAKMAHEGPRDLFEAAATWSAEFHAAHKALLAGKNLALGTLSAPCFLRLTAAEWDEV